MPFPPQWNQVPYLVISKTMTLYDSSSHITTVFGSNDCWPNPLSFPASIQLINSYITGTRDVWHLLHQSTRARSGPRAECNKCHASWVRVIQLFYIPRAQLPWLRLSILAINKTKQQKKKKEWSWAWKWMASRLDYVVSPSLLENLTIHPVSPWFNLGVEEWADACLESLERSLSASLADEDDYFGNYDDTRRSCSSRYPKSHPPTSAHTLPLRPHLLSALH